MSTNGAIYEAIVKNCEPYTLKLGGPIDGVVADFYKSPENPTSLTGNLATKFNQKQLQDAGVLRKKTNGELDWAFPFAEGPGSHHVFAIRKIAGQVPHDLVTNQGCISFRNYPGPARTLGVLGSLRNKCFDAIGSLC